MRSLVPLALILSACPGLPTETEDTEPDTDPGTSPDPDTDTAGCPEDLLEDNDDAATAAPWDPSAAIVGQVCAADEDWFALTLPGPCEADLDLEFTNASGDLDLEVWAGERRVAASSSTGDGETARVFTPEGGAAYEVRVRGFGPAVENAYVLTAALACDPCVVADAHEENDTPLTAVPAAMPVLADACPEDADWFQLVAPAAGCAIDAALSVVDGDPADLALTAADGTLGAAIASGWADGLGGLRLRVLGPASAAIGVSGARPTRYELVAARACPLPVAACPTDDGWANGAVGDAILVPTGESVAAVACADADDHWRLDAEPGCVDVLAVSADAPVDLVVRDAAGADVFAATGTELAFTDEDVDRGPLIAIVRRPADASTDPAYTLAAALACAE